MVLFPEADLSAGDVATDDLWGKIQQQTRHALARGALHPIETRYEFLEEGGIRFLVRILANLERKAAADRLQQAQQRQGKPANPFLPYDPDLFVGNLSDTHLCLLNKYNVVDHHILIVTRAFESQDSWLTPADFEALALTLAEIDGLAFYNGGRLAGASQPHKHLQLVPHPLCPDGSPLPMATAVAAAGPLGLGAAPAMSPLLPYRHALLPLGATGPSPTGPELLETYQQLLAHLGSDRPRPQPQPYNLVATRRWMLAVPRQRESYETIPVNALGFAGSLLVKNSAQLAQLKGIGPLALLQRVAQPQ